MKQMVTCPMCDGIMMTEWGNQLAPRCIKKCYKNPSHWIELHSDDLTDEVYRIEIRIDSKVGVGAIWAVWDFNSKKFEIGNARSSSYLPWFEPDISSIKIIEKVKTYIAFS